MSLWAGSTSFDNQPLLLLRLTLAEFLSADDARGRSYGVDCVVLRNGRFLNFPPVPKPLSSRAVAMRQRERERGAPKLGFGISRIIEKEREGAV